MAINKVVYGNNTLIDITDTTAVASDVASGKVFYLKDGTQATGTASGSSGWELLGSSEFTVNSTSTSASSVGTINCGSSASNKSKIIYVKVRDKAGKRAGYFLGSDAFFINYRKANGSTSALTYGGRIITYYSTSSQYGQYVGATTTGYGVYGYSITNAGVVNIYRRYNSNYSLTINGTYKVEVYAMDFPNNDCVYN